MGPYRPVVRPTRARAYPLPCGAARIGSTQAIRSGTRKADIRACPKSAYSARGARRSLPLLPSSPLPSDGSKEIAPDCGGAFAWLRLRGSVQVAPIVSATLRAM